MAFFFVFALAPAALAAANAESYFQKAVWLREQGRFYEARRRIEQALERDPGRAAYRFELANIYAGLHDELKSRGRAREAAEVLGRAAAELDQAAMLDPGFVPARFNLGVISRRLGQYERAREGFKTCIDMARANRDARTEVNALIQIAGTYEDQGFWDDARDYYEKAARLDYGNPEIQNALADLEERAGQPEPPMNGAALGAMGRSMAPLASGWGQQQLDSPGLENQAAGNALPGLGAMLLQQFLSSRGENYPGAVTDGRD
jgi:tetratricopeptide (TPR) repeat protein